MVHSADGDAHCLSGPASVWPSLANPSEAAYAVASLTLLPHGLIGVMLAAMFSATMANLSAQFNLKSAILSKDVYQALFRKSAGEHELLRRGLDHDVSVGGATTVIAAVMAASGQSVFQIMLTFNTLMSLAYGPPALAGAGGAPDASVVWAGLVRHWTDSRHARAPSSITGRSFSRSRSLFRHHLESFS